MSKARDIADNNLDAQGFVRNTTTEVFGSSPVLQLVYGPDDVPASLTEGTVYIQVEPSGA